MNFIVWNDRLSVGVAAIDREHKELISILNDLYQAIDCGSARETVSEALGRLTQYTENHFAHEERLFTQTTYPDVESHHREHAAMAAWLSDCRSRYDSGRLSGLSLEVVNYLKDWLFDHILGSDRKYIEHLHAAGIS
jgi:hemerythrin